MMAVNRHYNYWWRLLPLVKYYFNIRANKHGRFDGKSRFNKIKIIPSMKLKFFEIPLARYIYKLIIKYFLRILKNLIPSRWS